MPADQNHDPDHYTNGQLDAPPSLSNDQRWFEFASHYTLPADPNHHVVPDTDGYSYQHVDPHEYPDQYTNYTPFPTLKQRHLPMGELFNQSKRIT
jgi:hypothetical protein